MGDLWRFCTLATIAVVVPSSPAAKATDIVGLGGDSPRVHFDVPQLVVAEELASDPAHRRIQVKLPVTVVVAKGDVDRVAEVVVEVDGQQAGLTVHDFSPATTLTTEFAGDIEIRTSSDVDRHLDGSLGGILPNPGGPVAQLTPSVSAGAADRETETETLTKLAPKEATVVAGAINRRQGVLFKFRPSSQTTLEGERTLAVTFTAPTDWSGGDLVVRCHARGQRRVLFVKQRKIWGSWSETVAVRPGAAATFSQALVDQTPTVSTAGALLWKARKEATGP